MKKMKATTLSFLCLVLFSIGNSLLVNAGDNEFVSFLVVSKAKEKYEMAFPVPLGLTRDECLKDSKHTFKNTCYLGFSRPDAKDVFISIEYTKGVTKEYLKQAVADAYKEAFENNKTPTEFNGKRFVGYSYISPHGSDKQEYWISAFIYLDDKFFIWICIDNVSYSDAGRLLKEICDSFDNSVVRKLP